VDDDQVRIVQPDGSLVDRHGTVRLYGNERERPEVQAMYTVVHVAERVQ
jgi:hypothetical protein